VKWDMLCTMDVNPTQAEGNADIQSSYL